jgi:hypothetical protein
VGVDEHESVGTEIERANGSIFVLSGEERSATTRRAGGPFVFAGKEHRHEYGEE